MQNSIPWAVGCQEGGGGDSAPLGKLTEQQIEKGQAKPAAMSRQWKQHGKVVIPIKLVIFRYRKSIRDIGGEFVFFPVCCFFC